MGSVGFCGYSHGNPVGMGWGWVLEFHSHGSPAYYIIRLYKYSICLFHFQAIVYFLIASLYQYLLSRNQQT